MNEMPKAIVAGASGRSATSNHPARGVRPVDRSDRDSRSKATWEDLAAELARWRAQGRTATFWWRDDDAVENTPALGRLLDLRNNLQVPLALAVVPAPAKRSLVDALGYTSATAVLQHGWSHRNHGLPGGTKIELGAGRPLWELPEEEMIRAAAAFKCAVVLSDPEERGRRAILNLGHTFAHALEAASGYALPHGDAVALGLLAALRLSGQPTDVVEEVLAPRPVALDPEAAWAALARDKKTRGGRPRLVLLDGPGEPRYGVELPEEEVRAALDGLIAR